MQDTDVKSHKNRIAAELLGSLASRISPKLCSLRGCNDAQLSSTLSLKSVAMRPPNRGTEGWAVEQIRSLDDCLDADAAASIIKKLLRHYVDTSMPYVQRQALLSWLERNQNQVNHDSLHCTLIQMTVALQRSLTRVN
jgi:hypothetical protein